ncbi:hypothetical protein R1sor_010280 [Riccia sorocarpa]|uniref:Uncharacterized protein n=1 Tax=Riccia sorocarpa TaxID=122646 RepID=A0ABD3HZH5_9MARC
MRIYRIKCRIKWLKDNNTSSKYRFACLKAKNRKEEITSIKLESGEVIMEEGRILKLIEETYGELYTAEVESPAATERRREVLQLVDKKSTDAHNMNLDGTPSEELIEEIVQSLPQEKSPGFDGVTVECSLGWVDQDNPKASNVTWERIT